MQYSDIIDNGTLVYKSLLKDSKLREWPVKETSCAVRFYKTEDLSELELVLLRLISSLESNKITKEDIALTLGFDVAEKTFGDKRFYRDQAEVSLFNSMIDSIFKWHLAVEESDSVDQCFEENSDFEESEEDNEETSVKEEAIKYIRLTGLGNKALEMNCKFSFYEGKKRLLENVNKSELSIDTVDFPFYSELGFYSEITDVKVVTDFNPDEINIEYTDDLIKRINLQSNKTTNVFEANTLSEWKYLSKSVDVCLYQLNDDFYPIILLNDKVSVAATDILYREQNAYLLNKKIKKALYSKLINNADSTINYNEIRYFEDEIEQDEFDFIVRDSRTDWSDIDTYNYIVSNKFCNNNNWDYISKYCPEDIIIQHVGESCSKFDMITLSRRLPISFIIESCAKYAWEMSVVLSRNDITKQQAQKLMLCDENTNIEWDWEIVKPFLDVDFVVNNIDHLNIDFYNLTSWLPSSNQDLIVKYCHKSWNWSYFSKEANVNLVIQNINILQEHIAVYIETVLDKIFSDDNLTKSIVTNNEFAEVVKSIKRNGHLISYNLGSKENYIWSDVLIEYLEKCDLLIWNTNGSVAGFAQYPYIEWTPEFFNKYHVKINSASDYTYISENIKDISLITEYPNFSWDWNGLSRNKKFAESEDILYIGQDKILYSEWMKRSSTVFTSEFFASHIQWMKSEENASFVSSIVNDFDIVMKFLDFPWNWNKLAGNKTIASDERFCALLNAHTDAIANWLNATSSDLIERYFDTLGLSVFINKIAEKTSTANGRFINNSIWDYLSSNLSVNFIFRHLNEKWNKEIITQRLIPLLEEIPDSLDNCKSVLDWSVLSKDLDVSFIKEHIHNYVDYWNWSVLTNRVDPKFLHIHFKDYVSLWDKDTAVNRITSLLDDNDLNDPELDSVWDWHLLSESVRDKVLLKILSSKADYLDWNIVSSRISNMEDMDFGLLLEKTPSLAEHLDWNILNKDMALPEILKFKDLQNAVWDWNIITKRFDTGFIVDNLAKYAQYWDWEIILNEKINRSYVKDNLEHIKDSIADLESDTKEQCWKTITSLYAPAELLELSEQYNPTNGYEWNYSYIYKAIFDLDDFVSKEHSYVDNKALSASQAANNMFAYDSDTYVFRTWKAIIKSKLNDGKYNWNFSELTKLDSIQQKNDVFYELTPERWDWNYISQFGICLSPAHNGKYLRKYRDRLNFKLISTREDINIDDNMVSSFIEENWDWKALSSNTGTNITFGFIFKNRDKEWDWSALSKNSTIKWNDIKLREVLKDPVIKAAISWDDVVAKRELHIDDTLIKLMDGIDINWFELSGNPSFSPSIKSLKRAIEEGAKINWSALSKNQNIDLSFVREYRDFLDWKILTSNKNVIKIQEEKILDEFIEFLNWSYVSEHIELTNPILVKYKDYLIWKSINNRFDYNQLDLSVIDSIKDKIDWTKLSSSSVLFTEDFLHQYRNSIDWFAFSKNESVDFTADLYKDFVSELNRVKFIETLSKCDTNGYRKLKVYHFSHLFNAIEIIKNRKIMSRNKAEETKSLKFDAAGSVVHRTSKAHPFARFYYRPKSPTQFYNECLGWDSSLETNYGKNYYSQACDLHLPKCPMPVFFEFDIREIIAKYPEKCYYSTGNLQTNAASVLKLTEKPDCLRLEYLYHDISDSKSLTNNYFGGERVSSGEWMSIFYDFLKRIKEQSQQEFLVKDELDFMQLESLRIICYDEFQKDLLINYLGDDEIVSKIEVDYRMYSHENRQLKMMNNEDAISITSDYDINGCAYLLVKGGKIKNKELIKNRTTSGIIMYPSVVFDKHNPPSEVYLIDPNPRADTKEWLIYKS